MKTYSRPLSELVAQNSPSKVGVPKLVVTPITNMMADKLMASQKEGQHCPRLRRSLLMRDKKQNGAAGNGDQIFRPAPSARMREKGLWWPPVPSSAALLGYGKIALLLEIDNKGDIRIRMPSLD